MCKCMLVCMNIIVKFYQMIVDMEYDRNSFRSWPILTILKFGCVGSREKGSRSYFEAFLITITTANYQFTGFLHTYFINSSNAI